MQFAGQLRNVWSWLPAFRAVAETEHLPTAAHELAVVPSSLSRTVKLIEDELGIALFDRTTKALVLNDAGRVLLLAVRNAMRLVDDALVATRTESMFGNVVAAANGDLAQTILGPACAHVAALHPGLCASAVVCTDDAIPGMLMRGDIDVAIALDRRELPELHITELGSWTRAVYGSAGAAPRGATLRCVALGTPSTSRDDGWPAPVAREIAAWASDERTALEMVARGDLVTVAFDAVVRSGGHANRLVRLPDIEIPSRTLYLVHRRPVGVHRRTDAVVAAIHDAVRGLAV